MSLSHRRSPRGYAKRYALLSAFYDRQIKETVCLVDTIQVLEEVKQHYEEVPVSACIFEKGEVLLNQYGQGSLQLTHKVGGR